MNKNDLIIKLKGNLIATGGVDMKLRLINTTNGKLVNTLDCKVNQKSSSKPAKKSRENDDDEAEDENDDDEEEEETNSIESISFSKQLPLVACATLSGQILVWEINSSSIRNRYDNESIGYSKLIWTSSNKNNNNNETLYASTLGGEIQIFDGRNMQLLKTLRCHKAEILDFCLNQDGNILYTVSNDGCIKLFQTAV